MEKRPILISVVKLVEGWNSLSRILVILWDLHIHFHLELDGGCHALLEHLYWRVFFVFVSSITWVTV